MSFAGADPVRVEVVLDHHADFEGWRAAARRLVAAGVAPRDVEWRIAEASSDLFGGGHSIGIDSLPEPTVATAPRAPKSFVALARAMVCHKAADRHSLAQTLLMRLQSERALLEIASDPDVARAQTMAKNVRRCSHKMKAFVRFRLTHDPDGEERYVAWFEPEHHTLDYTAGFFERRFSHMRWSILTPLRSAHYDGRTVTFAGGATRDIAPDGDVNEDLWRTYFAAIFNPARLKVDAMRSEMPKRYWKNMPEGALVAPLIRAASDRTNTMLDAQAHRPARSTRISRTLRQQEDAVAARGDADNFPSIATLTDALRHCTRCALHGPATLTVPGEGQVGAALMFVGEQPGDHEDIAGRPFVGPAGQLFERALADAQIPRASTFITNAVKHFKFEPRGKRRIHKSPDRAEIEHCRFWLDQERELVGPQLTVALGATAARALSGKTITISRDRGQLRRWRDGTAGLITIHPSYILRLHDCGQKRAEYARFVDDLRTARGLVRSVPDVPEGVVFKRHAAAWR